MAAQVPASGCRGCVHPTPSPMAASCRVPPPSRPEQEHPQVPWRCPAAPQALSRAHPSHLAGLANTRAALAQLFLWWTLALTHCTPAKAALGCCLRSSHRGLGLPTGPPGECPDVAQHGPPEPRRPQGEFRPEALTTRAGPLRPTALLCLLLSLPALDRTLQALSGALSPLCIPLCRARE